MIHSIFLIFHSFIMDVWINCINKFFFKCVDFQDSTNSLLWSNCILQGQQRDNQVKIVGFDGYYLKESSILNATLRQDSIYCSSFNWPFLWLFTKLKNKFYAKVCKFSPKNEFLDKNGNFAVMCIMQGQLLNSRLSSLSRLLKIAVKWRGHLILQ